MSLHAFHLGQTLSTVLGQIDHGGQGGNAARARICYETSETDPTQKQHFRHVPFTISNACKSLQTTEEKLCAELLDIYSSRVFYLFLVSFYAF